jgi:cytochrome c-type biogenesis protein CcmH/NrfF
MIPRRTLFAAVVGLAFGLCFVRCAPDDVSTQTAIEERLTCQCGCGLTVHTCNHLQCSFAIPVKNDIAASLAAGQSAEQMLARYVDEYGEKILSAPTPEGFNLVAWFGPYVAVLFGFVGIVLAMRRWKRLAASRPAATATRSDTTSEADRARLEKALKEMDS